MTRTTLARSADLVGVLEAAYCVDGDTTAWLYGILDASYPLLTRERGVTIHVIELRPGSSPAVRAMLGRDVSEKTLADVQRYMLAQSVESTVYTQSEYGPCGTLSDAMGRAEVEAENGRFQKLFGRLDVHDVVFVRALDVDGRAIVLASAQPAIRSPGNTFRATWSRVAVHVSAGHRLRRALGGETDDLGPDDAVLRPDGTVAHARGDARPRTARERLRDAAKRMDRARTKSRRKPREALDLWRGLVAGRWSLVDRFDSDGRHFVVARRNDPNLEDPRALSRRERQVAAYAALGYSNAMIGYALGLSRPTVATHLRAALIKLGVESRLDLVRHFGMSGRDAPKKGPGP